MSPGEKLVQVAELNRACEQLSEAGVRSRNPDADDNEVQLRVFALRLGRELMVKVYDWDGRAAALQCTDVSRITPGSAGHAVTFDVPTHHRLTYRPGVPLVRQTIGPLGAGTPG